MQPVLQCGLQFHGHICNNCNPHTMYAPVRSLPPALLVLVLAQVHHHSHHSSSLHSCNHYTVNPNNTTAPLAITLETIFPPTSKTTASNDTEEDTNGTNNDRSSSDTTPNMTNTEDGIVPHATIPNELNSFLIMDLYHNHYSSSQTANSLVDRLLHHVTDIVSDGTPNNSNGATATTTTQRVRTFSYTNLQHQVCLCVHDFFVLY
jgi:hypothetical protein